MRTPSLARRASALSLLTLAAASCGDGIEFKNAYGAWVELNDIAVAPKSIRRSADAVVSLVTAAGRGTGFFVDAHGLLMTNEHVLGAHNCVREGCYVDIGMRYEKGATDTRWMTVRAIPVFADRGLDVGLYRLFPEQAPDDGSEEQPIVSPHHLTLSTAPARETVNQKLYVVGHPLGQLKKWVAGYGQELSGDWLETTNFILPGNSGSPLITREGEVVGLMHRSDTAAERLLNEQGAVLAAYGSTAEALREATGLGTDTLRTDAELFTPLADADTFTLLAAARQPAAELATAAYEDASQRCDEALLTYADHISYPGACVQALSWVDCSDSAEGPAPPRICPAADSMARWPQRADALNSLDIDIQGEPSALWIYRIAIDDGEAVQAAIDSIIDQWLASDPVVTLRLASTVLRNSSRKTAAGIDIQELVRDYRTNPTFHFEIGSIRRALFTLRDRDVIDDEQLVKELIFMLEHPLTPLGERLTIESILQASGFYGPPR